MRNIVQKEAEIKILLFDECSRVKRKRRVELWQVICQLGHNSSIGKHSEQVTTVHWPHFDNMLVQR